MKPPRASPFAVLSQVATVRVAVVILTVIAVGFTFWTLRGILTPFILAVFLLLMVDGLARGMRARIPGFPSAAALPAAIVFIVVLLGLSIWLIADNTAQFASQAPAYTVRLNSLLQTVSSQLGLQVPPTINEVIARANPTRFAGLIAAELSHVAEGAIFVLIYLGFLIASRHGFAKKTQYIFPNPDSRAEAALVFGRVRGGVESYIWVQTIVGVLIAVASAILMKITGLSHVMFWAFIIFLANYIPAIGAAIGVLFPALFGLLEFDDLMRPIVLIVGLEAVHFIVSHVIQPRMQGKSLNVDPIVVLLSLAFWGAIWGVTGAFLSTPLTVMAMAILAEFRGTRPLAALLSSDGKPFQDMEKKQKLEA
jgi:AI-2 transport protein TqsA